MKNYTIKELTKMFWRSIVLILILAVIGGLTFGLIAKKKQQTTYTAARNVVIIRSLNHISRSDENDNNSQNTMVNNEQGMMQTYKEIAEDNQVTNLARKELPKKLQKEYSSNDINNDINVKSQPGSLVLEMKATTKTPEHSVEIVNANANAFKKELPKIQPGAGKIVPLAKANKENVNSTTTPKAKRYAAVGTALGGLIGIVISFTSITLKDISQRHEQK